MMKRVKLVLIAVAIVLFTGCPNPADSNTDGTTTDGTTTDGTTTDGTTGVVVEVPTYREMVEVTGGTFQFEKATHSATNDKFTRTVVDFSVGKYEVTYDLWYEVLDWAEKNGYSFANKGQEGHDGVTGAAPTVDKYEPVTKINFRDAYVWCNAYSEMKDLTPVYYTNDIHKSIVRKSTNILTKTALCTPFVKDADGYRLPTREESQYAFIGGNKSKGYIFAGGDTLDTVAWWYDNSNNKTHKVGELLGNEIGLHDMSGNVSEFVFDPVNESYNQIINVSTTGNDYRTRKDLIVPTMWFSRTSSPTASTALPWESLGIRVVKTVKK